MDYPIPDQIKDFFEMYIDGTEKIISAFPVVGY